MKLYDISRQLYGKDPGLTAAIKTQLKNSDEVPTYNGKQWVYLKASQSTLLPLFLERMLFIIRMHVDKTFKKEFSLAVKVLEQADKLPRLKEVLTQQNQINDCINSYGKHVRSTTEKILTHQFDLSFISEIDTTIQQIYSEMDEYCTKIGEKTFTAVREEAFKKRDQLISKCHGVESLKHREVLEEVIAKDEENLKAQEDRDSQAEIRKLLQENKRKLAQMNNNLPKTYKIISSTKLLKTISHYNKQEEDHRDNLSEKHQVFRAFKDKLTICETVKSKRDLLKKSLTTEQERLITLKIEHAADIDKIAKTSFEAFKLKLEETFENEEFQTLMMMINDFKPKYEDLHFKVALEKLFEIRKLYPFKLKLDPSVRTIFITNLKKEHLDNCLAIINRSNLKAFESIVSEVFEEPETKLLMQFVEQKYKSSDFEGAMLKLSKIKEQHPTKLKLDVSNVEKFIENLMSATDNVNTAIAIIDPSKVSV